MTPNKAEEKLRFQKQAALTAGAALLTISGALIAKRSVRARVYKPNQFQANHIPPKFNMTTDAVMAIRDASLLAGGFFAFGVFATCWCLNVSNVYEFGETMATKLGGREKRKEMEADPTLDKAIENWFKKD